MGYGRTTGHYRRDTIRGRIGTKRKKRTGKHKSGWGSFKSKGQIHNRATRVKASLWGERDIRIKSMQTVSCQKRKDKKREKM